jgi:DNA-binding NarL/FixJ family response regulator
MLEAHSGEPIGIFVLDHQPLFREGVAELLAKRPGFSVTGQAATGVGAADACRESPPDVVLVDLDIPGEDPAVTIRRLQRSCGSFMIGLSAYDNPLVVQEVLGLGLSGYLLKTITIEELASTIRGVCRRAAADDGRVTVSVSRTSLAQAGDGSADPLSDREKEILLRVAEGLSNAQIGSLLHITEGTVKRHLRTVFIKLGAVSRIDAVNKAVAKNVIPSATGAPESRPGSDPG